MRIVLAHDVKMYIKNSEIFTSGGINDTKLKRYKFFFQNIELICREIELENEGTNLSKITIDGISRVSLKKLTDIFNLKKRNEIKKSILKSDGVIALLPSFIGLITIFYAKKYKKKYLIELQGCPWDVLKNLGLKGKVIAPLLYLLTKIAVNDTKFCLYVTNQFLQNRYKTKGKSIGVSDVVIYKNSYDILKKRINKIKKISPKDKIIIGTLGSIEAPYKGHEYIIKILKEIGMKYEYQIVGPGNSNELEKKIYKNKVQNQVKIIGTLPHTQIFDWLDEIDIYIQPSKTEGLPRALVEAMSRGCFCLGSDIGGIPELLDKDCLFKVGDIAEIREKILNISKNNLYEQAKRNWEKSKEFSTEILSKKRNDFYKEFYKRLTDKYLIK